MNVPVHVKVPVNVLIALQDRLRRIQSTHSRMVERKGKVDPALHRRGKYLTLTNMVRMAVLHGQANVVAMSDTKLIEALANDGIVRGRPVDAAA